MDLNIKLRDEKMFEIVVTSFWRYDKTAANTTIRNLEMKNIITVGDFLNEDVNKITKIKEDRQALRIIQDILNYKYKGIKMVREVLLERTLIKQYFEESLDIALIKQYFEESLDIALIKQYFEESLNITLKDLGLIFYGSELEYLLEKDVGESIDFGESIKVIEVLKKFSKNEYVHHSVKSLIDFYITYYEEEINKENDTTQDKSIKNDIVEEKTTIESLKDELIRLLNQRNALDTKISELLTQINTLEGEKKNGRKKYIYKKN